MSTKREHGFTLVELMITVAIVGILAALAVYSVSHYVATSKSAEARNAVAAIAADAAAAFNRETNVNQPTFAGQTSAVSRKMCASASTSVPGSIASVAGKKYQSSAAEWAVDAATNGGFSCLGFTMDQPQYYMYSYTITNTGNAIGDSFTAMAQGELSGNSATSTYKMMGTISSKFVLNLEPSVETSCVGQSGGQTCPDM